jgi:hypothetical protein
MSATFPLGSEPEPEPESAILDVSALDPIALAMQSRAQDLSLALQPQAVARRLRDELQSRFPDRAHLYYIGAKLEGETLTFDIAIKTPHFLASLIADSKGGAELGFAYHTNTAGGWEIEIGVQATGNFRPPRGASPVSGGSFSVTISR